MQIPHLHTHVYTHTNIHVYELIHVHIQTAYTCMHILTHNMHVHSSIYTPIYMCAHTKNTLVFSMSQSKILHIILLCIGLIVFLT